MKDEACRLAIELYVDRFPALQEDPPITLEEIRELMERPAARRRVILPPIFARFLA
jgi:hypothetical protein